MKKILVMSLMLLGVIFLAGCGRQQINQTQPEMPTSSFDSINDFLLLSSDLPQYYKLITKEVPVSQQASSLYNKIDLYSEVLGVNPIDKWFQSFESSNDSGTVYYILFDDVAKEALPFSEGLIWGESYPSKEHPDEIFTNGNMLIVLSFKGDSKIKEIIKSKITTNQSSANQQIDDLLQKEFAIPNHGTLVLNIPQNWNSKIEQPENNLPPTITIDTYGGKLRMMITPIWKDNENNKPFNLAEIKKLVEERGDELVQSAAEKNYTLRELNGVNLKGYYFDMLTDKKYETISPPTGEYKYIMSAKGGIDELLLIVTFFSNSNAPEQITQGLEMLKNIEHNK